MKAAREYRVCTSCNLRWNVSTIYPGASPYVCPRCYFSGIKKKPRSPQWQPVQKKKYGAKQIKRARKKKKEDVPMDINVNIKVSCADLVLAATALGAALRAGQQVPATAVEAPAPAPAPAPEQKEAIYTKEQLMLAGGNLIRDCPDKMPELQALLSKYGVQAVPQIPPDALQEFGDGLKALGADL